MAGKNISIGGGVNLIIKGGVLKVGSGTYFTADSRIEVTNSVSIGSGCAISWGVTIIDSDHHQVIGSASKAPESVEIRDKVWIGCNVTILKGTIIGNNSVVGAGSVVKGVFPDNCLIAGNPAKVIRTGIDWK